MKQLRIVYGDQVLYDSFVEELVWTDNAAGVKVEGRNASQKPATAGLLDILSGLSRSRTEQKREELINEPVAETVDEVEAEPIFVGAAE